MGRGQDRFRGVTTLVADRIQHLPVGASRIEVLWPSGHLIGAETPSGLLGVLWTLSQKPRMSPQAFMERVRRGLDSSTPQDLSGISTVDAEAFILDLALHQVARVLAWSDEEVIDFEGTGPVFSFSKEATP